MKKEVSTVHTNPHGWLQMDELPFGKTLAYELIEQGELESVTVGKVGTRRGRRLVSLESLNRYLQSRKEAGV